MIKVNQATKRFDGYTALNQISCNIPKGCIYGMVGSNGAGKSTLLRLINGIYRLDGGSITIDDEPVFENVNVKQNMVFVPDDLFFMGNASMDRMAKIYASVYPKFDDTEYEHLKSVFQLNGSKSMHTFSKGMKRQGILILALCCRTDYIFFDETFDGLDPVMRNLVKSLICKDVMEREATAVITSHSLRELEDTCDQLALLHKGGLVLQSDVGDLKTNLFKVQLAFGFEYDKKLFENLDFADSKVVHFSKHGSVSNVIMRGDREQVIRALQTRKPLLLEVLPLTLEEVFTYEMELLGYSFGEVMEEVL